MCLEALLAELLGDNSDLAATAVRADAVRRAADLLAGGLGVVLLAPVWVAVVVVVRVRLGSQCCSPAAPGPRWRPVRAVEVPHHAAVVPELAARRDHVVGAAPAARALLVAVHHHPAAPAGGEAEYHRLAQVAGRHTVGWPQRLRQHLGRPFRFVELANDVNEHMPDHVYDRIVTLLNRHRKPVNGSRVLLLGLAYKRGTSDWRESPTVPLAERLDRGMAQVRIADPHIPEVNTAHLRFPLVRFTADELAAADLVVVLVDHPEFTPALIAAHAPLVFDAKGLMRGTMFEGDTL